MLAAVLAATQGASAATDAPAAHTVVIAEVRPEGGRLILIWPAPTAARLALHGDLASLLADRPVPVDVAAATTLAPWLLDLAPGRPPEALLLRPGVRAILTQPR